MVPHVCTCIGIVAEVDDDDDDDDDDDVDGFCNDIFDSDGIVDGDGGDGDGVVDVDEVLVSLVKGRDEAREDIRDRPIGGSICSQKFSPI